MLWLRLSSAVWAASVSAGRWDSVVRDPTWYIVAGLSILGARRLRSNVPSDLVLLIVALGSVANVCSLADHRAPAGTLLDRRVLTFLVLARRVIGAGLLLVACDLVLERPRSQVL